MRIRLCGSVGMSMVFCFKARLSGEMQIGALWQDAAKLEIISKAAALKAKSWTEAANAATLLSLIDKTLP